MGFLNQSLSQLRELFASMTPAARITSALLLGVIVVSLGYLFQGHSSGSQELLFGGEILQPREATDVEAAIAKAGFEVLPRQAGRIVAPRGKASEYLAAVASSGALPANFDKILDESLSGGLLESSEKGKQRYKAARERQLSMLVSDMDGIDDAQVLYDIREPKAFEKQKVTATVSVRPAAGESLDARRQKLIREAIAGSIAGLDAANVTIFNRRDGSQFGGGSEVMAASFDTPYFQERTTYEQMVKSKIEDLLHYIPGVRIQVSAELDPTLGSEVRSTKENGDAQILHESNSESNSSNSQAEDRGRPGPTVNGPTGPPPEQAVAKNEQTTTDNQRETQNFVPVVEEHRTQAGLAPQRVSVTIAVPTDYLTRVWRETTPDAAPDAKPDPSLLSKIEGNVAGSVKSAVSQLIPREKAQSPYPNVEVTFFQSLTPDAVEPPSMVAEGLLWAKSNSGSLMMGGLAIVSLLMLRSMVKAIPTPDPMLTPATPALALATTGSAAGSDSAKATGSDPRAAGKEKPRQRLRLKKGPTLKDDLTEMVREDPDGAAAILRGWIGNAG